jgi:glutamine synthetase
MLALQENCGVKIICGLEIEWYLIHNGIAACDELRNAYLNDMRRNTPFTFELERATGQVEAIIQHTDDLSELVKQWRFLRSEAQQCAEKMGLMADFSAKPFADDYGSGLHLHLHLESLENELLFWVEDDVLSDYLGFALAGLLAKLPDDLLIFAGSENGLGRYQAGFNAPINVSWGFNNRTTAIRLPDNNAGAQGLDAILQVRKQANIKRYKRIEHRVASAEANLEQVLTAILEAIRFGINLKISPPAPIYGNAEDYELPLLISKYAQNLTD